MQVAGWRLAWGVGMHPGPAPTHAPPGTLEVVVHVSDRHDEVTSVPAHLTPLRAGRGRVVRKWEGGG